MLQTLFQGQKVHAVHSSTTHRGCLCRAHLSRTRVLLSTRPIPLIICSSCTGLHLGRLLPLPQWLHQPHRRPPCCHSCCWPWPLATAAAPAPAAPARLPVLVLPAAAAFAQRCCRWWPGRCATQRGPGRPPPPAQSPCEGGRRGAQGARWQRRAGQGRESGGGGGPASGGAAAGEAAASGERQRTKWLKR